MKNSRRVGIYKKQGGRKRKGMGTFSALTPKQRKRSSKKGLHGMKGLTPTQRKSTGWWR